MLMLGFTTATHAQLKIGYANLELILAYMPETNTMNQTMQSFDKKLAEQLKLKKDAFDAKMVTYQEKVQGGATQEQVAPLETELQNMQQELLKAQQDAQDKSLQKRQGMLEPILDKLQGTIKKLAEEGNYTYILNSAASGTSIILHGVESANVTKDIMTRMGIPIPKENSASKE